MLSQRITFRAFIVEVQIRLSRWAAPKRGLMKNKKWRGNARDGNSAKKKTDSINAEEESRKEPCNNVSSV